MSYLRAYYKVHANFITHTYTYTHTHLDDFNREKSVLHYIKAYNFNNFMHFLNLSFYAMIQLIKIICTENGNKIRIFSIIIPFLIKSKISFNFYQCYQTSRTFHQSDISGYICIMETTQDIN